MNQAISCLHSAIHGLSANLYVAHKDTHIHGLRTKSMDFRASGKYGFTVCAAQSVDCANPYIAPNIIYTEYVKKNATNVPQQHLKMRCHVRCFLSPCESHFDGHAAVRHLVKRRNPRIAVRLPKCGTLRKSAAIPPHLALPAHMQRQTIKVLRSVLSNCGAQILQIAFFLIYTI